MNYKCDESGMDNSPRFDTDSRLFAIDFSCFMANEARSMAEIAGILDDRQSKEFYNNWFAEIKAAVNKTLWSEEDGFYYDYDIDNGCLHKVESVASFLPLFAGICEKEQAMTLVNELKNPETFYCEFPIPSISKRDKTFGTDMWRGPVWINYNYMLSLGLYENGYLEEAREIRTKTAAVLNEWYTKKGTIFEFYDSENKKAPNELNRKGAVYNPYDFTVRYQSIRDYGWSNTLTADILMNKF